jgi:hypothetical protein
MSLRRFARGPSLLFVLLGLAAPALVQCGGDGTGPSTPPPPPPPANVGVDQLDSDVVETLCTLSNGIAALLAAASGQTEQSSTLGSNDCAVADVPEIEEVLQEGQFESIFLLIDQLERAALEVESQFDAAVALFRIDNARVSSSQSGAGSSGLRAAESALAADLTLIASNDDQSTGDRSPRVVATLRPNVDYLVVISGFDDTETGSYTMRARVVEESEPETPDPGSIRVSAATSGSGTDEDGYRATLSGSKSRHLEPNGSATFGSLAAGDYSVALGNVAENCQITDGDASRQVTVRSGRQASVSYQLQCSGVAADHTLTVSGGGTGSGTVTSNPAGIDCAIADGGASGTCAADFAEGTDVSLTASAASGSDFGGWSGDCAGTGACSLSMSQPKNVTATFNPEAPTPSPKHTLTVNGTGSGGGTVTSSPAGIDCTISAGSTSGACAADYDEGTDVSLAWNDDDDSHFKGWSGACSGTAPCAVTMDDDKAVTVWYNDRPVLSIFSRPGDTNAGASVTLTLTGSATDTDGIQLAEVEWAEAGTAGTCDRSQWNSLGSSDVTASADSFSDAITIQNPGAGPQDYCWSVYVEDSFGTWGRLTSAPFTVTWQSQSPPGPPTISNPRSSFVTINQCGIANNSRIQYTVDYVDPDGDVDSSSVKVRVSLAFSDGGSSSYVSDPQFNSVSGDGFSGSVTADNCILFGAATWADATLRVEDTAGNVSNAVTTRVDKPAGAN